MTVFTFKLMIIRNKIDMAAMRRFSIHARFGSSALHRVMGCNIAQHLARLRSISAQHSCRMKLASGGQARYCIAVQFLTPRFTPRSSTHAGFRLGAICSARRRRERSSATPRRSDRRASSTRLEQRLAEHRLARKSSALGWLFGQRAADRGRSRASTSTATSAAARPC